MTVEEVKNQFIRLLLNNCNECLYNHYLKILDDIVRSKQLEDEDKQQSII